MNILSSASEIVPMRNVPSTFPMQFSVPAVVLPSSWLEQYAEQDLLGLSAVVPNPSHKGNFPSHGSSVSEISCLPAQILCPQGTFYFFFLLLDKLVQQAGCSQGNMPAAGQQRRPKIWLPKKAPMKGNFSCVFYRYSHLLFLPINYKGWKCWHSLT